MNYRKDFPIFSRKIDGKPLAYLDSAATSQKPQSVIDAISGYYSKHNANTHRGIYRLSEESTSMYEEGRALVAGFINGSKEETIFTKGATESLNAISHSIHLRHGDEIVTTIMEHHANLIPLQQLAKRTGAKLKIIDIGDDWQLDSEKAITDRTKLVSVTGMSNVLGTRPDVKAISALAHDHGAVSIVDAAQLVAHHPVDVKRLDCDFMAFSSHKMLGPAGVGVLWGKRELLDDMDPFLFGGGMIREVTEQDASWDELPFKFEAGTPNLGGVIGFAEAIRYLNRIGMDAIERMERELSKYALDVLNDIKNFKLIGTGESIISFSLGKIHPHDISTLLDTENVAIRAGHHCAMPLMKRLGIPATARASFYIYNTKEEIELLAQGLKRANEVFG